MPKVQKLENSLPHVRFILTNMLCFNRIEITLNGYCKTSYGESMLSLE